MKIKEPGTGISQFKKATNKKMNNELPLVSVLMTAYNRQNYIGEAIESVLLSSYKNFELIIVDDCSTDDTVAIAKEYAKDDQRISVFINETNLKDYPNRNKAASYAKGVYIIFVDSDDKIYTDSIEYCVNKMLSNPEVKMGMICYGNDELKDKVVKRYEAVHSHFFNKQLLTVGPGGTFLNRLFFEKIGRYPEIFGPANDMYFNIKAATETDILMFGYEFLYYRIHAGQEQNNQYSYLYNNYNYLNNALREIKMQLTPKQIAFLGKKNKRRFIINSFSFLREKKDLSKFIKAYRLANFGVGDFLHGVFN